MGLWRRLRRELAFLLALWKTNLLSAMEYRTAFLVQVFGMMLNDGLYCIFWTIFFARFKALQGWGLNEILLLFGMVAAAYGLGLYFFGNSALLADIIADGRLDYYLSLPRPVLPHVLASYSSTSALGDIAYGLLCFVLAGYYSPGAIVRFVLGILLGMLVLVGFSIMVQSLAFWIGNSSQLSHQLFEALLGFASYPATIFDGPAKFVLFTIVPAAFLGTVPAQLVRSFTWSDFALLVGAAAVFFLLALASFHLGLRRYESGSSIQTRL